MSAALKHCCQAVGCKVLVPQWASFCGPHNRMVPKSIRDLLARKSKLALEEAIRAVAAKEGKLNLWRETQA